MRVEGGPSGGCVKENERSRKEKKKKNEVVQMNGEVKFFDENKGFGFIKGEDGNDYFVHVSALQPGTTLRENDRVTFDIVQGNRGPKAGKVVRRSREEESS